MVGPQVSTSDSHAISPAPRRVLAFTPAFLPGYKAGGPIKSIVEILDRLPESIVITLVTSDRDLGDSTPYEGLSGRVVRRGLHEVYYLNPRSLRHWLALLRWTKRNSIDLVYVNSLWSPLFTVVPILALRVGVLRSRAVLLAPRGELSPGALGIKSAKKQVFLLAWAPLLHSINLTWHASTEMEKREIQDVFPWARIVIQVDSLGDTPRKQPIESSPRARFVFIGRLAAKKNLRLALEALCLVQTEVDFDIYGPKEDERYWTTCQEIINQLPPNVRATYLGALPPPQIRHAFAQYDGFIFPTLGENFGHVIAESLSAGCPVICSRHTPWTEVLDGGGGAALTAMDARVWADEISRRATQTPAQRSLAKRTALETFEQWRDSVDEKLAIETVLDDLKPGTPASRAPARLHGILRRLFRPLVTDRENH